MDALWTQIGLQMETLPERLGGHVFLSLTALLVGTLLSVPLGIWAYRYPRFERLVLATASLVQTIPGLALLALMVFVWGTIGWLPALIALILYSVLPILRNTVTGLKGIDPALLEAAQGVGMSHVQSLRYVQLPLAVPVIVAGIRTAAVWVVGAATIAQPVGATSLGNYIFVGLQTMNFVALIFGCVLSALLALVLDGLLHGFEVASARRSWKLAGLMTVGISMLAASPLALTWLPRSAGNATKVVVERRHIDDSAPRFVVGSKPFTEQYIWTHVIRRQLEAQGLEVDVRDGMGSAAVFQALASGQLDCYVDYTGTIWANYMKRPNVVSPVEMLTEVTAYLVQKRQIYCLGPLGFSNDYAFATTRDIAEKYAMQDLVDLSRVSRELRGGTDIEFFDRPEWRSVESTYGIDFDSRITMDATLMYGAVTSGQLDVIIAFNTDARLDRYNLVVLEDPKYALPPYDAILLVSPRMARNARAMKALRPLVQSVNSKQMRRANGLVDVDGQPIQHAANYVLAVAGLVEEESEDSHSVRHRQPSP